MGNRQSLPRAKFHRAALAAIALIAAGAFSCSRDFAVPALLQAPLVQAVTPAAGFSDDNIVITGTNLGGGLAQVFFGVRPATLVSSTTDGTSLTVAVPTLVTSATVSVVTPNGRFDASNSFTYRGAGHPTAQSLNATVQLSPSIYSAAPLIRGTVFAMLDQRYDTLLELNIDGSTRPPVQLTGTPQLVFGDDDQPWIYDSQAMMLEHFDIASGSEIVADEIALVVPDGGTADTLASFASPGGRLFADFVGIDALAIIDTVARTQTNLSVGASTDTLTQALFTSESALLCFTTSNIWRVDLSTSPPTATVGDAFLGSDAPGAGAPALSLLANGTARAAYLRNDGQIGLIDFSAADPSQPALLERDASANPIAFSALVPYPDAMSFSPDGKNLLIANIDSGSLVSFDTSVLATTPVIVSSHTLSAPFALAPITAGPLAGYVAAGLQGIHGVAVLLPNGELLQSSPYPVQPDFVGTTRSGDALVASAMGLFLVDEQTLNATLLVPGVQLQGMQQGQILLDAAQLANGAGDAMGWTDTQVFRYLPASADGSTPASFPLVASTGEGTIVQSAALSADGKWVEVVTDDTVGTATVTLFPQPGNSAAQQMLVFTTENSVNVEARYLGNNLVVQHPDANDSTWFLSIYAPDGFSELESQPIGSVPDPVSPYFAPSLGGFVTSAIEAQPTTGLITGLAFLLWQPKLLGGGDTAVTGETDATVGTALRLSTDGRVLFSLPSDNFEQNSGLELSDLSVDQASLIIEPVGRVALPAQLSSLASTSDGGRLYVTLTSADMLAIIE